MTHLLWSKESTACRVASTFGPNLSQEISEVILDRKFHQMTHYFLGKNIGCPQKSQKQILTVKDLRDDQVPQKGEVSNSSVNLYYSGSDQTTTIVCEGWVGNSAEANRGLVVEFDPLIAYSKSAGGVDGAQTGINWVKIVLFK